MPSMPPILIVDDDVTFGHAVANVVQSLGAAPVHVDTLARAHRQLRAKRPAGVIVDHCLPDGFGTQLLPDLRAAAELMPVMLLTAYNTDAVTNMAYDYRAHVVCKPLKRERLVQFVEEAMSMPERLHQVVRQWRARYRLTDAEADILLRSAKGESRMQIAGARGSSPATVKRQIAEVLRKTADDSLTDGVLRLMRQAAGI